MCRLRNTARETRRVILRSRVVNDASGCAVEERVLQHASEKGEVLAEGKRRNVHSLQRLGEGRDKVGAH